MRICIDIQPAIGQRAGVGRYTKNLVEHLGDFAGRDELSMFYFDFKGRGLAFDPPHTRNASCRWIPGRLVQQSWKRLHWPPFDWFAGAADVYHFPNFAIPPLSRGCKVVTIHDMSFARYPQFAEERNLRYLTSVIAQTAGRADAIITDSRFSAAEITECLHVPPEQVFPIHLGIAPECRRSSPEATSALRRQLGLLRPYILTVGTLEPRKNIPFLIDLFEQLPAFDGDLVIAGMRGWKYEPILHRMQSSRLAPRIRYLEYVEDRHLPALYSGAEAFVTPSFYEGFGFPPLEAMACGTPVVSSSGGSLAEVLGDSALVLPEFRIDAWQDAVTAILTDTTLRQRLIESGLARAQRYDWRETARQTFEIYRRVQS